MARVLFLALLLPAAILGGLEDCTEFTVGQCQPPQELIVGLQHLPCDSLDLTTCATICQKICSVESNCDFFSYDSVTEDCVLLRETEHNGYYATCGVLAGGPAPTLWDCDQQLPVDDCKRFIYENCEYKVSLIYFHYFQLRKYYYVSHFYINNVLFRWRNSFTQNIYLLLFSS